jgi:hypothetical protein
MYVYHTKFMETCTVITLEKYLNFMVGQSGNCGDYCNHVIGLPLKLTECNSVPDTLQVTTNFTSLLLKKDSSKPVIQDSCCWLWCSCQSGNCGDYCNHVSGLLQELGFTRHFQETTTFPKTDCDYSVKKGSYEAKITGSNEYEAKITGFNEWNSSILC